MGWRDYTPCLGSRRGDDDSALVSAEAVLACDRSKRERGKAAITGARAAGPVNAGMEPRSRGGRSDEYEMAGRPSAPVEGGCLGGCGVGMVRRPLDFVSFGGGWCGGESHRRNYGYGTKGRERTKETGRLDGRGTVAMEPCNHDRPRCQSSNCETRTNGEKIARLKIDGAPAEQNKGHPLPRLPWVKERNVGSGCHKGDRFRRLWADGLTGTRNKLRAWYCGRMFRPIPGCFRGGGTVFKHNALYREEAVAGPGAHLAPETGINGPTRIRTRSGLRRHSLAFARGLHF